MIKVQHNITLYLMNDLLFSLSCKSLHVALRHGFRRKLWGPVSSSVPGAAPIMQQEPTIAPSRLGIAIPWCHIPWGQGAHQVWRADRAGVRTSCSLRMLACETPTFSHLIVFGRLELPNYVNQLNVYFTLEIIQCFAYIVMYPCMQWSSMSDEKHVSLLLYRLYGIWA